MEKNTVVLSVDEYNELRDLRTKLEEGEKICISYGYYSHYFKTTDEKLIEIAKINKEVTDRYNLLKDELKEKNNLIKSISKMSIQEFRKWRKPYNSYEGY